MLDKFKKMVFDEKGVSPVIGVMLMIVVVVLLAAAVSAYSSTITTQEPAPSATLQIDSASASSGYIELKHMSGDVLTMGDMKVEIQQGTTSSYVNSSNVTTNNVGPGDTLKISGVYNAEAWGGPQLYFDGTAVHVDDNYRVSIIDSDSGQIVYTTKTAMNP